MGCRKPLFQHPSSERAYYGMTLFVCPSVCLCVRPSTSYAKMLNEFLKTGFLVLLIKKALCTRLKRNIILVDFMWEKRQVGQHPECFWKQASRFISYVYSDHIATFFIFISNEVIW